MTCNDKRIPLFAWFGAIGDFNHNSNVAKYRSDFYRWPKKYQNPPCLMWIFVRRTEISLNIYCRWKWSAYSWYIFDVPSRSLCNKYDGSLSHALMPGVWNLSFEIYWIASKLRQDIILLTMEVLCSDVILKLTTASCCCNSFDLMRMMISVYIYMYIYIYIYILYMNICYLGI